MMASGGDVDGLDGQLHSMKLNPDQTGPSPQDIDAIIENLRSQHISGPESALREIAEAIARVRINNPKDKADTNAANGPSPLPTMGAAPAAATTIPMAAPAVANNHSFFGRSRSPHRTAAAGPTTRQRSKSPLSFSHFSKGPRAQRAYTNMSNDDSPAYGDVIYGPGTTMTGTAAAPTQSQSLFGAAAATSSQSQNHFGASVFRTNANPSSSPNQNVFGAANLVEASVSEVESKFDGFSIGASPSKKKKGSPGFARRNDRWHAATDTVPAAAVETPGVLDMSIASVFSPPSARQTASKPSIVRPTFPSSDPPLPFAQQQQQQQKGKPRKIVKVKLPNRPKQQGLLPFNSPPGTFSMKPAFGINSEDSKGDAAPSYMTREPPTSRHLFMSPEATTTNNNKDSQPLSARPTCPPKKYPDTASPSMEQPGAGIAANATNQQEDFFKVDLGDAKPRPKKSFVRGRAARKEYKDPPFRNPIQPSHTEDTASVTDNSPSNGSTSEMSWSDTISPNPSHPIPASTVVPPNAGAPPAPSLPVHCAATNVPQQQPHPTGANPSNVAGDGGFHLGTGGSTLRTGLKKSQRKNAKAVRPPSNQASSMPQHHLDIQATLDRVITFREQGKMLYQGGDYRKCIETYTDGIAIFRKQLVGYQDTNLLGVMFSNRSAALLMVGAYQAACDDCTDALQYTRRPTEKSGHLWSQPSLIPRLYNRRARANGKLGDLNGAEKDFEKAVETAREFKNFFGIEGHPETFEGLDKETIEATNGRSEILRCRMAMEKINSFNLLNASQNQALEALKDVNGVLAFCSGSSTFIGLKIMLLQKLKRWRELIRFCERTAAEKVKLDSCFPMDLTLKNPLPGVPNANHLKPDAFDGISDDDIAGVTFTLPRKASGDVVLRLPTQACRPYVRALRLSEDYASSGDCIQRLTQLLVDKPTLGFTLGWLVEEKNLIDKTQSQRKHADALFFARKYKEAAIGYQAVAQLDPNAGSLLDAVMHCNRAACFMATEDFVGALSECNKALHIHPRYMKALLRRARCQVRLDRLTDASLDFKHFFDYTQQATNGDASFIFASPFVFEGPHQVKSATVTAAKEEQQMVWESIAEERRNKARQREYARDRSQSERFGSSNAWSRKQNFYKNGARPWDSFTDRGSKRSPNSPRSRSNAGSPNTNRNGGRTAPAPNPTVGGDHYSVLGVSKQATAAEIKKQYRKLALVYHPDKNKDPAAEETFRKVQEAYDTLREQATRRQYDREQRFR